MTDTAPTDEDPAPRRLRHRPERPVSWRAKPATAPEEAELAQLRTEFPGHRIWLSTRYDGSRGDWVATLWNPYAGLAPHVVRATSEALRAELLAERERVKAELAGRPAPPAR